jgi:hypothetical protein
MTTVTGGWEKLTSNTLLQPRQQLTELRNALLQLHQVLLEAERITYEQVRGRVSAGELLQLVIYHEQFAWLHPISELVVQIDELLRADEPEALDQAPTLIDSARSLLTPAEEGNTFESKYYSALQHNPAAVLAHAGVAQILNNK